MDKSTIFEINGEKYDVVKRGIAQAKQVAAATRWLAKYGTPAFRAMAEQDMAKMGGFEVIVAVLSNLDEYALVELFEIVFGCSREIAEQNFDIMVMVDGLVSIYNNAPMIRTLADRFFSQAPSADTEATSFTQ